MRVPQEVLNEMRYAVRMGDSMKLCPEELQALLDERAVMLAAVKDIATAFRARAKGWPPGGPTGRAYLAAARDLESHPAFCGIEKE